MEDFLTRYQEAGFSFLKFVNKTDSCWLWIGGLNRGGYGQFKFNKKQYRAHRFSYLFHYGHIPEGLYVCHSCDVRNCVNPQHLWLGSQKQNLDDRSKKGRSDYQKGENCHLAKLTWKEVDKIRSLYKSGNFSYRKLSKMFGLSIRPIAMIIKNLTWKV